MSSLLFPLLRYNLRDSFFNYMPLSSIFVSWQLNSHCFPWFKFLSLCSFIMVFFCLSRDLSTFPDHSGFIDLSGVFSSFLQGSKSFSEISGFSKLISVCNFLPHIVCNFLPHIVLLNINVLRDFIIL